MQYVLVTGANKGIGFAIVKEVLRDERDVAVFLGSRSRERGDRARAALIAEDPSWEQRVRVICIDVADRASVESAAAEVRQVLGGQNASLVGVVNNAGVGFSKQRLDETLQVNVHGIHRICTAFVPLLDPATGRVVNITSAAGPSYVATCSPEQQERLTHPDVTWEAIQVFMQECLAVEGGEEAFAALGLGSGSSYGISKACANALTLHWARQHPGLRINACTPGFIETDLTRPFANARGITPAAMGMKSPKAGTVAPLLLLFGELEGTGRYYGSDGLRSPLHRYRSPGDPPYTGE